MATSDLLSPSDLAAGFTGIMDVVEIPVLLPGWQAQALEDAAHLRGLTAGEMLRHLLTDFFKKPSGQTNGKKNGSQVA